jgi:hypothetical protein
MWRLYVGGLLTGFAIGGFVVWLAIWAIVSEPVRFQIPSYAPLVLLPFLLAGETLRMRGQASLTGNEGESAPR